ncbi:hypothetical protein C0J52_08843, partial [Blattella germanica]
ILFYSIWTFSLYRGSCIVQSEVKDPVTEEHTPLLKTKTDVSSARELNANVIKCSNDRPLIKPPLLPKPQTPLKPLASSPKHGSPITKPLIPKRPNLVIPFEKNGKESPTLPMSKLSMKAPVAKLEEFDSFCDGPVRPPRSPKNQPFKGDPFKVFEEKPELPLKKKQLNSTGTKLEKLQTKWETTKEKSASLGRTNAFRYVEGDLRSASLGRNRMIDYALYVENEMELEKTQTPVPPPRQRKKSCEHSSTPPVYAQVNYSMKKNRRQAADDENNCADCNEENIQEELSIVEGKLVLPGTKLSMDSERLNTSSEVEIKEMSQVDIEESVQIDSEVCEEVNEKEVYICKEVEVESSEHVVNGCVISEDKTSSISALDIITADNESCSGSVDSRTLETSEESVVKLHTSNSCLEPSNENLLQSNSSQLYRIVRSKSEFSDGDQNAKGIDLQENSASLVTEEERNVVGNLQIECQISTCDDFAGNEVTKHEISVNDIANLVIGDEEHSNNNIFKHNSSNKVSTENEVECNSSKLNSVRKVCRSQSASENLIEVATVDRECSLCTSSLPSRRKLEMKEPGKLHRRRLSWSSSKDDSSPEKPSLLRRKPKWWCDEGELSSGTLGDLDSSDNAARQSSFEEVSWGGSDADDDSLPMRSKLSCWLGSFGKGCRKHKPRRDSSSQFYCDNQDKTLKEKQNPNMEVPQNVESEVEGILTVKDDSKPSCSSSTLSPLDVDQKCDAPTSEESFDLYQQSESDNECDITVEETNESQFESEESRLHKKAFYIAQELMTSERVFIDVLKLLNEDFRHAVRAASCEQRYSVIPEAELDKILNSLPQLQHLNEDLLQDLEIRIENWSTIKKISDVIVEKGPFLKLYTSYIKNFEIQSNYLEECCQKYPRFAKVVKEFEASPRCRKLSLKHYMLKPVQRIPQYRLLLEDYLRHLPSGSPDKNDTEAALRIVCDVAEHANRSIKLGDHLSKLLQLQSQLGNYEIIKPGRIFLKDGELFKLSRKGMQPRYFILLNDCLLYTSYYGTVQSSGLKVNYELPLFTMKVSTPQSEDYRNEFNIISVRRSFTLCAKSLQERQEWVDALQKAISDYLSRQLSFQNMKISAGDENSTETFILGQEVVCGDCSDFRAPLQYMKFQSARVCEECYETLFKEANDPSSKMHQTMKRELGYSVKIADFFKRYGPASGRKIKKFIPRRLKEVMANDTGSQMSGWLQRRSRRSWKRYWFVLKEQVLYVYKASEDVVALESIPVLGYTVEAMKDVIIVKLYLFHLQRHFQLYEGIDAKLVFQLVHPGQHPFIFHADSDHLANRYFSLVNIEYF